MATMEMDCNKFFLCISLYFREVAIKLVVVSSSLKNISLYFLPSVLRATSCQQKGFSPNILGVLTKVQQNRRDSTPLIH